jgi:hypothetical protein
MELNERRCWILRSSIMPSGCRGFTEIAGIAAALFAHLSGVDTSATAVHSISKFTVKYPSTIVASAVDWIFTQRVRTAQFLDRLLHSSAATAYGRV